MGARQCGFIVLLLRNNNTQPSCPHLQMPHASQPSFPPAWAPVTATATSGRTALQESLVWGEGVVVITSTWLFYFVWIIYNGRKQLGGEGTLGSVFNPTCIDSTQSEKNKPIKKKNHFLSFLSFPPPSLRNKYMMQRGAPGGCGEGLLPRTRAMIAGVHLPQLPAVPFSPRSSHLARGA